MCKLHGRYYIYDWYEAWIFGKMRQKVDLILRCRLLKGKYDGSNIALVQLWSHMCSWFAGLFETELVFVHGWLGWIEDFGSKIVKIVNHQICKTASLLSWWMLMNCKSLEELTNHGTVQLWTNSERNTFMTEW